MRGSDPDAAVYYLARMLYAGEDVKFIARRIMICASEDVGNADPNALVVAVSAAQAGEPDHSLPGGRLCRDGSEEQCGLCGDPECDEGCSEYADNAGSGASSG